MHQGIEKEVKLVKFNTKSIDELLEKLKNRDPEQKGYQPELTLGCFRGWNVSNNSKCLGCKLYIPVCKKYLEEYIIE